MTAVWLVQKVAHRNIRAVGKAWKLLPCMSVFKAVRDDMMIIFNGISNLLGPAAQGAAVTSPWVGIPIEGALA